MNNGRSRIASKNLSSSCSRERNSRRAESLDFQTPRVVADVGADDFLLGYSYHSLATRVVTLDHSVNRDGTSLQISDNLVSHFADSLSLSLSLSLRNFALANREWTSDFMVAPACETRIRASVHRHTQRVTLCVYIRQLQIAARTQ